MATKEMKPQQANELLNALAIARAECARAKDVTETYSDLYDQLEYTMKHIDATYDSVMGKFVPPILQRTGGK